MKFKHFLRTAAAAACIVALAQAQGNYWKLTVLPFPVGGDPMAIYCPISFDGGFVTGNLYEPTQEGWDVNQVFLYRVGDPAPTTIANNSGAIGVSADGAVLGGLVDRGTDVPKNMWGWTYVVGGTASPLPNYTSYWQKYQQAVAISADANLVLADGWKNIGGAPDQVGGVFNRAVGTLLPFPSSVAGPCAMNSDATAIAGIDFEPSLGDHACLITLVNGSYSVQDLPFLDPNHTSGLGTGGRAISESGSVVVGDDTDAAGNWHCVRWSDGNVQDLGYLADELSNDYPIGTGVSPDGNVVIGSYHSAGGREGFIWSPTLGLKNFATYLATQGVNLPFSQAAPYCFSGDGTVLIGYGLDKNGSPVCFLLTLPEPHANNDSYLAGQNNALSTTSAQGVMANDKNSSGASAKILTRPQHGQLVLNMDGSFNYQPDTGYLGKDTFTYKDTHDIFGSLPATVTINVVPAYLKSLSLSSTQVIGDQWFRGTLSFNTGCPGGSATFASNNPSLLRLPSSLTIAKDATTASFVGYTNPVSVKTNVTITTTFDGVQRSASLTLLPAPLESVTASANSVVGGNKLTGQVRLNGYAANPGAKVTLLSSYPAILAGPASVTIPAGGYAANFTINTAKVKAPIVVTLYAVYNGVEKTALITVNPS